MSSLQIDRLSWSPTPRRGGLADILRNIVLEARPGEFVGLIGPNGSGKTSLLRCAFRFSRPRSGTVAIEGVDVWTQSPRWAARRIAVLLQETPDDFGLSVEQLVAMGRTPYKGMLDGDTAEDVGVVREALADVGLAPHGQRLFASLSGGEKQRALLARALVQRPEVLMLDEPTNHLDPRHQMELLALVRRQRVTTIATIHDLNLAAVFCDRLYVIADGAIVVHGTPDEVLTRSMLKEVYGVDAHVDRHPVSACPRVTLIAPPQRLP